MSALFPNYARWDIEIVEGKGTKVIDKNGKEYLDFIAGIAVCNLGHRPPKVQKAIEEQLNKVWHVSNLFQASHQEGVAKLLTEHSVGDYVFFCNSGAEANEAAIKIARKHTGRHKIITFKQSFHGRTFATMTATGQEKIHSGFGPLLQEFIYLPYNDENAIEEAMNDEIAAVMLEVIQGEGGVNPGEDAFLKKCQQLCEKYGALFIIDEVQTGIGRTGKAFAYQHADLSPDIITVAKGLGSGFPVGAMIGKAHLKDTFSPGTHGSTFGGTPLAMAAAKATLEEIFQAEFLQQVREKSEYFLTKLNTELDNIPFVKQVKGKGLLLGIECDQDVSPFIEEIHKQGLLVLTAGPKVIRLLPPLTVSFEEIDQAVQILKQSLQSFAKVGL
ncbi:acetylornithine transaminase [Calidifontibacillus erzurumensis]|uniref:Acetylornithine aminotransferase n=1 Tax=Calidifontibacillus erzurumensis TaxID=2741433 RepID=A0A8J8GCU6_9BACI|nr:acetylornithine transaminase [Calidifontibacillus erzurumensis]NSL51484.1 acetylornithine transaminase [Calidifontibacillus erzurumensis]